MLTTELAGKLVEQIGNELYNSHQYATLSVQLAQRGLKKLSARFSKQSTEEHGHAQVFSDYLMKCGVVFAWPAVPASQIEPDEAGVSWLDEWAALYVAIENNTTTLINELMNLAIEQKDNETQSFLQPLVDEQVGEMYEAAQFKAVTEAAGTNVLLVELAED